MSEVSSMCDVEQQVQGSSEGTASPAAPVHCQHFVKRKKRYCRMSVRAGSHYCGEHEPKLTTANTSLQVQDRRIACPLDPKHTCYASKLEKHLKVCNAKQKEIPPFISKNCNILDCEETDSSTNKRCLSNVSEDVLREVIRIVEKIYNELILGNIMPHAVVECHASVAEYLDSDGRKDATRRHLLQTSSLLNIMETEGLMKCKTSFVELGAGKGHVSYYLSKAVKLGNIADCSFVLVDRASHRHKQENKIENANINRIRADISDLVLGNVGPVQDACSVVAVSKHLCGVATDLALRCLTKSDVMGKIAGLVMATCCHHRCLWGSYVGNSFLKSNGIGQSQFNVICGLVSWATCGSGLSRERRNYSENTLNSYEEPKRLKMSDSIEEHSVIDDEECKPVSANIETECLTKTFDNGVENNSSKNMSVHDNLGTSEDFSVDKYSDDVVTSLNKVNNESLLREHDRGNKISISKHLGLSSKQREDIGFKAKAVLDWGRMLFLKDNTFECYLRFYVERSLSPENVCIVATRSKM